MQLLRITRRSKGIVAVFGMFLSAVGAIGLLLFAMTVWESDSVPAIIACMISVLMGVGSIHLMCGIVSPYESEFVMEPEGLRFGRTDRPGQQRRIARSKIKSLTFEDSPGDLSLHISTGGWFEPLLAPGIIVTKSQMTAVVEMVRNHWPEILVYDREGFQKVCRSRGTRG